MFVAQPEHGADQSDRDPSTRVCRMFATSRPAFHTLCRVAVASLVAAALWSPMSPTKAAAKANELIPASRATGVPTDTQLLIKFDEIMKAENGNITVWRVPIVVTPATTGAQIKASVPVKHDEINVDQSSKWVTTDFPKVNMGDKLPDGSSRQPAGEAARWVRITIKALLPNTSYFVLIDSTAFQTASTGERFSVESETTWLFTTGSGPSSGATTTVPGATTTTVPSATCPGITFPGRAPRWRIDATQAQFSNKALACSISLITRSKLVAVAIANTGTLANSTVASYSVKATRIGGSFLTKPVSIVAGPSVQRTQFRPLKTGSWTITVTALGPTGAVVAEWTSAAFPVRP